MDKIGFENLLNRHISVAKDFTGSDFKSNKFEKNNIEIRFYSNKDYFERDFHGMPYNHLTIQTDENDIVQSVTIHFRKVINREFYDSFNNEYGKPNYIQVVENRRIISETKNHEFSSSLKKSTFDLREGSFEEKPLYIIWEKHVFHVKALLRHEQNISEITFILPKKRD